MKRISALLSALIIFSCCACSPQTETIPELLTPVKVKPDTATVQYEDSFDLTSVTGCVLPYSEPLAFSVDGTIASVNVLPGQEVKKGDILALLDTSALQKQLDSLKQQLKTAQAQALLQNQNRELEIQICELRLSDTEAGSYEYSLRQLDLKEAQLALKQAKEQQAFEQQQLSNSIQKLSEQLSSATICAPFDGIVTWMSVNAAEGKAISAEASLFYLSDESRLSVRTERILSSELANCDRIYARIGDTEYELTARETTAKEDLEKSLNGIELTTTFDFIDTDAASKLSCGNNALVYCRSNYREQVLCVPSNALFRDSDGYYVYRMDDEEKIRTDVEIGAVTDLRTEIVSGLTEGDVVYVKD